MRGVFHSHTVPSFNSLGLQPKALEKARENEERDSYPTAKLTSITDELPAANKE